MNKLDTVKILTNQLHIFGLCETFLSDVVSDAELQIYNFKIERKDRQNKRGGGLLLYIHENVPYKRRIELENNQIESVWIEVRFPNSKSFLLNFSYRPPSSLQSWIDSYEIQISNALIENDDIYMLGDFNLDYNNSTHNYGNNKWSNMTVTYGLTKMITVPTRITKFSSTTIDHIYTTYPENVTKTTVPYISLSDHYPICFSRSIKHSQQKSLNKHRYMTYRSFNKFNEEKFNIDLIQSDLQNIEQIDDLDDALSSLYKIINTTLEIHAPMKTKRIKRAKQPEWYSKEIINASKLRNMYQKQKNWVQYKVWRNKTSYLIRKNKRNFYNKAIKETKNSSLIWKHIKNVTCQENDGIALPPQLRMKNDNVLDDPQTIVNAFNDHFLCVANMIERIPFDTEYFEFIKQKIDMKLKKETFSIGLITPFEVKQIIDKLNVNKSTGLDGIGPRIIKCARDNLVITISSLINKSIELGIFPSRLKEAYVLPLFKSGAKDDPNNYRPISILPTISKIFERHVANQLHSYFDKTDILHTYQSGFRKNHSCQTSLIALTDKWLKQMDNGKLIGTIFIDLKKAFDMVDHKILIEKLKIYHFNKLTVSWFVSYLENRNQTVKVGNTVSSVGILKYGVPQGSILGPLLFLLYINDLPMIIKHTEMDIYADDSTLHTADKHTSIIEKNLQKDLNSIQTWCKKNNMSINPTKTTSMLIGSQHRIKTSSDLLLHLNNTIIQSVKTQKVLGIHLDSNLKWDIQIDNLCKKLSTKLTLLRRISKYLSLESKKLYYNAYMLPLMDFCSIVWSNCNKSLIMRVNKIQKATARWILKSRFDSPSAPLFKKLGWLTFENRRKLHVTVLVYKGLNKLVPSYITELINITNNSKYNLRSVKNKDIIYLKPKTNFLKQSFSYSCIKTWNDLPVTIRESKSLTIFKKSMKEYLLINREIMTVD